MSKIKKEDPIEDSKYSREDREHIMSLFKIAGATAAQAQQVVDMYRKYVNPAQPFDGANCGHCSSNYVVIFTNLRNWMSANYSKFR